MSATKVLGCLAGEHSSRRIHIDGRQFHARRCVDRPFARGGHIDNRRLPIAALAAATDCRIGAGQVDCGLLRRDYFLLVEPTVSRRWFLLGSAGCAVPVRLPPGGRRFGQVLGRDLHANRISPMF